MQDQRGRAQHTSIKWNKSRYYRSTVEVLQSTPFISDTLGGKKKVRFARLSGIAKVASTV